MPGIGPASADKLATKKITSTDLLLAKFFTLDQDEDEFRIFLEEDCELRPNDAEAATRAIRVKVVRTATRSRTSC